MMVLCLLQYCFLWQESISLNGLSNLNPFLFIKPFPCSSYSKIIVACVLSDLVAALQSLSHVWLFATTWTAERQVSLSSTISRSLLKLISIELMMPSNHFTLCYPLPLLPAIFSSIRVFSNQSVLHIRWPKYWSFSFSISPSNEYLGLISLELTVLISLQSKGLSRVFCSTTVQSINSLVPSLFYGPILTSRLDYWKNYSFE